MYSGSLGEEKAWSGTCTYFMITCGALRIYVCTFVAGTFVASTFVAGTFVAGTFVAGT